MKELSFTPHEGRVFALILGVGLLLIGWRFEWVSTFYIIGIACIFLAGLMIPDRLFPVYRTWMILGLTIGWVVNRVLLTIVFCIVIIPLAMIRRQVKDRAMEITTDDDIKSYWHSTDYTPDKKGYLKQF